MSDLPLGNMFSQGIPALNAMGHFSCRSGTCRLTIGASVCSVICSSVLSLVSEGRSSRCLTSRLPHQSPDPELRLLLHPSDFACLEASLLSLQGSLFSRHCNVSKEEMRRCLMHADIFHAKGWLYLFTTRFAHACSGNDRL